LGNEIPAGLRAVISGWPGGDGTVEDPGQRRAVKDHLEGGDDGKTPRGERQADDVRHIGGRGRPRRQEDTLGVQGGDFCSGGDVIVLDVCELVVEVLIEDEEHVGHQVGEGHGPFQREGGGLRLIPDQPILALDVRHEPLNHNLPDDGGEGAEAVALDDIRGHGGSPKPVPVLHELPDLRAVGPGARRVQDEVRVA